MIHRVEIRNFKALREVSLELERLTLLVGPNASGKTSVLEAIDCLSGPGHRRTLKNVFGRGKAAELVCTRGSEGGVQLAAWGDEGQLRISFGRRSSSVTWVDLDGNATGTDSSASQSQAAERGVQKERDFARLSDYPIPSTLGPSVLLRLDPTLLRRPSYSDQPIPELAPDGGGLAAVLAYLSSAHRDVFEQVQSKLREVIPNVVGMRFPRAPVHRWELEVIRVEGKPYDRRNRRMYWGNSIEFDMLGAPRIPARKASEGTLLVLAILTAILGPNQPRIVLVDDIDRALHPKAQGDLIRLLRDLLDANPSLQIVATSHSPYLLDHLRPEEVRLTALRDDGSVACGRLDEHPEFEKWREAMTPGEFWSLVGEKWLVEAKGGGRS